MPPTSRSDVTVLKRFERIILQNRDFKHIGEGEIHENLKINR
jgi:hypothetical protein